jgi:tetratricopeptide (TPR) repeat protein
MMRWSSSFGSPLLSALSLAALLGSTCLTACAGAQAESPAGPTTAPIAADAPSQQQPSANALQQIAATAERRSQWSAAADAYLALVKAEPLRTDWLVAAGRCLGRSGRFAAAVDMLLAAKTRFPDALEVSAMLARTYLLQAERDPEVMHPQILQADAADLAESVLERSPNDEDSRLVLAQARYLLGERDEAIRQAQDAVQRHPQRSGAWVLLGRIHLDQLRSLHRRYTAEQPSGDEAATLVGEIQAARDSAAQSYRRAAELDPSRAFPHVALAQIAALDKNTAQVRGHLLDALVADPDGEIDHEALGEALDWPAREALYRQALERYGKVTTAAGRSAAKAATLRFYIGRSQFQQQQWQACRDTMTQVLAENPAADNAHWFLFLSAYRLDDHDGAERHAATYAATDALGFANTVRDLGGDQRGEVGAIVRYLADRAWQQKRVEPSRDLNHVTAFLHDTADAWNNHAFLCRETGRFEAAAKSYEHALQREPESPQLWNDAGVVLHYHLASPANLVKAKEHYERALQFADKVLGDPRVVGEARERAAKAKSDATANLAELAKK